MTKRSTRFLMAAFLGALLTGVAGCEWLIGSHLASFGAGYALGAASVGTQTTCYQNGELINCAELPAELQP